jgi:toxin ParE1/3/4
VTYRLHPEAALEHERQVAYYEEQGAGLGRRYHEATLRAIGKAVDSPQRLKISRLPDIRKISLQGFKFWVIYRDVGGTVQVLAVAHYRRHPDYWVPRA